MLKKVLFNIIFIILIILSNVFCFKEIKINENEVKIQGYINEKKDNYYMLINIESINLNEEIYPINSKFNNVNYGIELLKSDLPNIKNGNLILASHRGTSNVAKFNNLDKMRYGDSIKIYYKNICYKYIYTYKYEILKTGKANIKENKNKNQITLITCKKNEKNKQVIYVGYLE